MGFCMSFVAVIMYEHIFDMPGVFQKENVHEFEIVQNLKKYGT